MIQPTVTQRSRYAVRAATRSHDAAFPLTFLALAFGVVALIAALWSTHRLLGLLAGSLTFVVLGVVFGWLGARSFQKRPALLSGSLEQLDSDRRRAAGTP